MSTAFDRVYTDEQRDALADAYLGGIRPARRVVELAALGRLQPGLAPFDCKVNTVRDFASKARKRRRRTAADAAPDGAAAAIDQLRADLLTAVREELAKLRTLRNRTDVADHAEATKRARRYRELARALREAAAIPDSTRPGPAPGVKPGQRDPKQDGASTPGRRTPAPTSMAGGIMAAHRGTSAIERPDDSPAPDARAHQTQADNTTQSAAPPRTTATPIPQTDDTPGSGGVADADSLALRAAVLAGTGLPTGGVQRG